MKSLQELKEVLQANPDLLKWAPPIARHKSIKVREDLKRIYTEQFVDQILDLVDYSELLKFYVVDSDYEYNVFVLMGSESVFFQHCFQNEFPSPTEDVIGVIATTRGENSFLWEGYASYDEDGRLIVDETGEVVSDQAAFQAACEVSCGRPPSGPSRRRMAEMDLGDICDRFRSQLREQLLARLKMRAIEQNVCDVLVHHIFEFYMDVLDDHLIEIQPGEEWLFGILLGNCSIDGRVVSVYQSKTGDLSLVGRCTLFTWPAAISDQLYGVRLADDDILKLRGVFI